MKKVYVNPTIIVRDVKLSSYINQISQTSLQTPYNNNQRNKDGNSIFNDMDVSNDVSDNIWGANRSEFL